MYPLQYLYDNLDKLYIVDNGHVNTNIIYSQERELTRTLDFGDSYFNLRLPGLFLHGHDDVESLQRYTTTIRKRAASIENLGLLVIELFNSSVRLGALNITIPVILTRSLSSYRDDGILISKATTTHKHGYVGESLFHNPRDYLDNNLIIEMLRPIVTDISIMINNNLTARECSLCFIPTTGRLKFIVHYIYIDFETIDRGDSYSSPSDEEERDSNIYYTIRELVDIENSFNNNKRNPKSIYDNIHKSLIT